MKPVGMNFRQRARKQDGQVIKGSILKIIVLITIVADWKKN